VYTNTTFTKNHITEASGLKPTATHTLHSLYRKGLKLESDIGTYLRRGRRQENDDHIRSLEAEFDDMDFGTFNLYIQDGLNNLEDTKPGPSKPKTKKRKVVLVDSDAEDSEAERKRRKKDRKREKARLLTKVKGNKGKGKHRADSQHLDDSSDSSE
jgi:hypothetical protein